MHPVIRIICLIILSVFSTQGNWLTLLLTGVVVLPFYFYNPVLWKSARSMIWRLKWLFFSILLIYIVFSPRVSALTTPLNPYIYLLLPGLFRILVLINLIMAVNLLIKTTTKEALLTALLWLCSPLHLIHIDLERFLLRSVLTIEYIEILNRKLTEMQQRNRPKTDSGSWFNNKRSAFFQLVDGATLILQELFTEVLNSAEKVYLIEMMEPPGLRQWCIVPGLFLYLSMISYYFH